MATVIPVTSYFHWQLRTSLIEYISKHVGGAVSMWNQNKKKIFERIDEAGSIGTREIDSVLCVKSCWVSNACVRPADGAALVSDEDVAGVLHMFSAQQACSNFSCLSTISGVFCLFFLFFIQGLASDCVPLRLSVQDSLVVGRLPVWKLLLHLYSTLSSSPPPPFLSFPSCRQSDSRLC